MKRIIAGGTGFIGKHLVQQWHAQGHEIAVIGRNKDKINALFGHKVTAIDWETLATNGASWLKSAQLIVNLAGASIGETRWTKSRKQEILLSRINPTQLLAKFCAELGQASPALFNASAVSIYGVQPENPQGLPLALDEQTPINFAEPTTFLTKVARDWEQTSDIAKQSGVRVVNMRFGVVLAEDAIALERMSSPFYIGLGGPIGSGQQPFSWIALADLISALEFLIDKKEVQGAVNFVAPQCVTQKKLAQALGRALHRPAVMPTPAFLLKLLFGEMAQELLLQGQHAVPKRLLDLGFEFKYPDIDSALQVIYPENKD